jgi:hypothetical protein
MKREIEPSARAIAAVEKMARDAAKNDHWMTFSGLDDLTGTDGNDPGDIAASHREQWEQTCHWEHFYGNEISRICDQQERRFSREPLEFEPRYYGLYLPLVDAFWEAWEDASDLYGKIEAALNPPPVTPAAALESAADLTGWDKDSQLAVCLDYIELCGPAIRDAFAAYAKSRADADIEATAIR